MTRDRINKKYIKKILGISDKHIKKYGIKKMSLYKLDKLCELS